MVHPSREPGRKTGSRDENPDLAAITELKPDIVLANQEENRRIDVGTPTRGRGALSG